MHNFIILFTMLLFSVPLMAQKTKRVKAEYTYKSDNRDESLRKAEEKAFFQARCKALEDEFGATIGGKTDIETINENGHTSIVFHQHGGSEIRAEWLKTIKEEVRSQDLINGFIITTVYVEGMAREIKAAGVDFEYHILRNGETLEYEDENFKNNDLLYLMFKAPVDCFLAVYLTDEDYAYCLLPYEEQVDGIYKIKANKQYVFFSKKYAQAGEEDYKLKAFPTTEKKREVNSMYILFSQNFFTKRTDNAGTPIGKKMVLPPNVPFEEFEDWLYRCQSRDVQMRVEKKDIIITKK